MKLDYVLRRIAGLAQLRMVFHSTAQAMDIPVRGLIAGYGIRWNILWDSRTRGWEARDVYPILHYWLIKFTMY